MFTRKRIGIFLSTLWSLQRRWDGLASVWMKMGRGSVRGQQSALKHFSWKARHCNGLVFSSCSILNIVQHDIFTSMHKMNLGTNRWYLQGKEHLTVSANNVQLVFRRIAQLPFALQLSKAYVRLEGRSLLWLIMMSLRTSVAALGS